MYTVFPENTTPKRLTPLDIAGLSSGISAIAVGAFHDCALSTAGGVKCWGGNGNGQLGDGTTTYSTVPVGVAGLARGVSAISVGDSHTCALTSDGGVKCWSDNEWGQLGDGAATDSTTPVDVAGLTGGVSAIAAGPEHTCALTSGGDVKCWGFNNKGQLGDGSSSNRTTPVDVIDLTGGVSAITAGHEHTCALTTEGV